ncbi:hypothetical protein [Vibrio sp. TRT 17S01]|uniref:hypothetical protein n=1 Tax=Vibrio sp. TRT 17S01 TaxID=3418505 RepID=UPI003CEDCB48
MSNCDIFSYRNYQDAANKKRKKDVQLKKKKKAETRRKIELKLEDMALDKQFTL